MGKGDDYFYQNEGAIYFLQNFSESELRFKGHKFERSENGSIIGRDLCIKWRVSPYGYETVEYVKLENSDWRQSAKFRRPK